MIGLILIVVLVLVGHWEMWAGLHVKITFSICTGYDVIIVCPYVIATKSGRPDCGARRVTKQRAFSIILLYSIIYTLEYGFSTANLDVLGCDAG